jgi:hypothetical protein
VSSEVAVAAEEVAEEVAAEVAVVAVVAVERLSLHRP